VGLSLTSKFWFPLRSRFFSGIWTWTWVFRVVTCILTSRTLEIVVSLNSGFAHWRLTPIRHGWLDVSHLGWRWVAFFINAIMDFHIWVYLYIHQLWAASRGCNVLHHYRRVLRSRYHLGLSTGDMNRVDLFCTVSFSPLECFSLPTTPEEMWVLFECLFDVIVLGWSNTDSYLVSMLGVK
jgi:hypothetical protein